MIFFGLIIFLLLVLALGYLTLLCWPEADRQPVLALSGALGGGLIAWQLLLMVFIFKLSLGFWCLYLIGTELALLAIYHRWRGQRILPKLVLPQITGTTNSCLLLCILIVLVLALVRAWTNPLLAFDALVVWAYRVKILYYHQADLFNPDSLVFWLGLAKSNYPWHLSLLAWLQAFLTGGVSNTLINFLPWCYYAGLLATVYAMAKDKLSQTWSLALVLLVATMPLLFYHSYNFYADLSMSFYIALTCLVWRRWLGNQSIPTLSLTAVLSGLALMVKSEAIFFIGTLFVLSLIKLWQDRTKLIKIWPLALGLALYLPWVLWLTIHHLGISNVASGLGWHPQVTSYILKAFFSAQSWHLWWYLFALTLSIGWSAISKQSPFRYLLAWFTFSLSAFLALYYFTETYQYALDNTAFSRNMLIFIAPSAALIIDSLHAWFKSD